MNKSLKKFISLALATGVSLSAFFGFVGCTPSEQEKDPSNQPPVIIPEPGDKEQQLKLAVEKFDAFVTSLQAKKFSYNLQQDMIVVSENVMKINDIFYEKTQDGQFEYALQSDNQFHKTVYDVEENMDFFAEVDEMLSCFDGIEWKSVSQSNQLTGEYNNKTVAYQMVDQKHNLTIAGETYQYYDIGKTISLPQNVIDDTKPPIETENIYEIVNGEKVFNLVALREVLEPWLKGDNQLKQDFFAAKRKDDTCHTRKILWINATENKIEFGAILDKKEGIPYYAVAWVDRAEMYQKIADGTCQTKEEFRNELLQVLRTRLISDTSDIELEYTVEDCSAEQNTQFDAMTKNIFAELGIDGLEEKNVKFAFKTPHGDISGSAGNGYLYSTTWEHYYFVDINGKLELLKVGIHASTSRNEGEIDNVINHPEYWNINGSPVRTPLQKGNEQLYLDAEKETTLIR